MASINRTDYEGLINWLIAQREFLNNETHELITTNAFRNLIFELKPIYTGYASKSAIELHDGCISKMTPEHFNPRQRMSEKIIDGVKSGISKEILVGMLIEACRINYTTKDENKALEPLQKHKDYVPEEAYSELGIELVLHYGGKRGKKPRPLNIDGVFYTDAKYAAEYFSCGVQTVYNRVRNSGKKWSNWNFAC